MEFATVRLCGWAVANVFAPVGDVGQTDFFGLSSFRAGQGVNLRCLGSHTGS